ncbi:MAG: Hsp20/alpha crystallin family protein [Prosthecobacter sp.]|jgi:HSP20 family protein|uniref:Hsp20/alpha crystallin family protein n=1 Tax=Prosthecobacter sp. TaxID=1965333 RepID=UPI001A101091|nr:Hsp20/alpha crystallin family protein [Prosthecobacter sp.]MBE2284311.1 Hsp20/alpha crystallin family protein [Prosthecobacter sp.]
MNATCAPRSTAPATSGVTESLRKPLYNVSGSAEAYEVRIEMPGVPKNGVKIDLEDNILTVRGERTVNVPEGMKALHRELSPLSYLLRLRLNTPVDEDKMNAKLEDGVLILRLPIKEAAKPRQIPVL